MEDQNNKEVKKNEEVAGPIAGSIIVIIVIILGAIYLWNLIEDQSTQNNSVDNYIEIPQE